MQNTTLANISVQQLKRALVIRQRIQELEGELNQIVNRRSTSVEGGIPARRRRKLSAAGRARISAAAKARWAKATGKRTVTVRSRQAAALTKRPRRGQLKERIIRVLRAAGNSGLAVKDVATKLGTSYGNISVWFHTTAKGVKEIKKVAPGKFAWVS